MFGSNISICIQHGGVWPLSLASNQLMVLVENHNWLLIVLIMTWLEAVRDACIILLLGHAKCDSVRDIHGVIYLHIAKFL